MRLCAILLFALCALAPPAANAQWLEATIELPIVSIPMSMVANPTGTKLYVTNVNSDSSCIHVIDAVNNTLSGKIPCGASPGSLCLNTEGNKLYVPIPDGRITVIDAMADTVIKDLSTGRYPGGLCYYAARGRLYCGCGDDNTLVVIDAGPDTIIRRIPLPYTAAYLCLNEAEDKLYVSISASPWIEVVDCSADTISGHITLPSSLGPVCLSTQQNRLFCADPDSLVLVVDCAADTFVPPPIRIGLWPLLGCYSPAQDKAYFGTYAGQDVSIIDCATDSLRATIGFPSIPWGMCADSVSGNVYCTSRQSNQVLILDGAGDSVLATVTVGELPGTAYWGAGRHRAYVANENGHSISVLRDSPGAVAESMNDGRETVNAGPTIVRGVLNLEVGSRQQTADRTELLDAAGRKVVDLHSGKNGVSRLAPGVYFISPGPAAEIGRPSTIRRIIVAE